MATMQVTKLASSMSPYLTMCPMSLLPQGLGGNGAGFYKLSYSQTQTLSARSMKQDLQGQATVKVLRRSFAMATSFAAIAGIQEAEAKAVRKKAAPLEEKKPQDDKGLSAYDAKLLANYRRKEAMKESLSKQKAKAKTVGSFGTEAKSMDISGT